MLDRPTPQAPSVRSTCPYCGVGCGVIVQPDGLGGAAITGDPEHPANFGRLCSKGSALGETFDVTSRLLAPSIAGKTVAWDDALDTVAGELARIRTTYGPNAIAFYLSGQLLTEDYYVANKLAKGFIGTPHVDTNSRLCMASSVAGHKRAFGADIVPGNYEDLETADLVVLVGSNTAWCHPILYQRIQKTRAARGSKVVNIDPRQTATSEGADLHLSIASGSDTCLWNGLLVWLFDNNIANLDYIAHHTSGFKDALASARADAGSIEKVALHTGLMSQDIQTFYELWAATPRVVSCYSQGVNQAASGTDKVNAIINCHLATGRIAKPGAGPFSLTGQPNAMGGREVGGLANMLAAHMAFSPTERDTVGRFWNAPNLVTGQGYKAVDMFDAIARGEIKALWVIGTNPAVSMPNADAARAALTKLELFVVSEVVRATDTLNAAAIKLPAQGWGEKNGTVTNSERRISRQRAFLPSAGEARPDWWMLSQVAERLGWGQHFDYTSAADIFAEHAALTAFDNNGQRTLDLGGLAELTPAQYDALPPIQWPVAANGRGTARIFSDGTFATPDGRAKFIPIAQRSAINAPTDAWPILLNTGRIRDQWHTMTRTGLVARLSSHISEPYAEVNPADANALGITHNGLVQIESQHGAAIVRAVVTDRISSGTAFAPIHWSDENSSAGRVGALVHAIVDNISGQPDMKATPVRLSPVDGRYTGYVLSVSDIRPPELTQSDVVYWSRAKIPNGVITTFAIDASAQTASAIAHALLPAGIRMTFSDEAAGQIRTAAIVNGAVEGVVMLSDGPSEPPGEWLKNILMRADLTAAERRGLLAGRLPQGLGGDGPIVCVCHQVSATTILSTIEKGCASSDAIGKSCQAGTNCGSCLPEINRMLRAAKTAAETAKLVSATDENSSAEQLEPIHGAQ